MGLIQILILIHAHVIFTPQLQAKNLQCVRIHISSIGESLKEHLSVTLNSSFLTSFLTTCSMRAISQAYEKIFKKKLEIRALKFSPMANKL